MSLSITPEDCRSAFFSLCSGHIGIEDIISEGKICLDNTLKILSCVEIVTRGMSKKQALEQGDIQQRIIEEKIFDFTISRACYYCGMMIGEILNDLEHLRTCYIDSVLFGGNSGKLLSKFEIVDLILDNDSIVISFLREIPIWICLLEGTQTKEQTSHLRKRKKGESNKQDCVRTVDLLNRTYELIKLIRIAVETNK